MKRVNALVGHLQQQQQPTRSASTDVKERAMMAATPSPLQSTLISSPVASKSFQYTFGTNGVLSDAQREFYDKNGFVVIKHLYNADELEKYRSRFVSICNGDIERPFLMTVMRDIMIAKKKGVKGEEFITKIQDMQNDPVFWEYIAHAKSMRYVEAIVGEGGVTAIHNMLINKPSDLGLGSSRHPMHQDLWYFPHRPSERIVASWTAMQTIDEKNGCLVVLPGTHKGALMLHEYPNDGIVNKAYHGIQGTTEADLKKAVPLIMEPGDTVFFHPLLHHGSGRNLSPGYRKAISAHYAHRSCEIIDLDGTIQQSIKDEMLQLGKRLTGGRPFTMDEFVRLRYKPVNY